MGQKVHPYVLRIGFGKDWVSRWISLRRREYAEFLEEDIRMRTIVKSAYPLGTIASVVIDRVSATIIRIRIRTSRPGVVIGRRGQDIEKLKKELNDLTKKEVIVDVEEVLEPVLEAQLVAELIAFQMTKRISYRRAMKKAMQQAQALGCEGMRLRCSGRLDGVEIARSEIYKYGKIPLQTFRADIDYGHAIAKTTYGTNGVKIWIYKGEKKLGSYLIREGQSTANEQESK